MLYGDRTDKGAYAVNDRGARFQMEGHETYLFAVDNLAREATAAAGLRVEDTDLFVPHQANRRISESAARRASISMDRVFINIEWFGNTSAATIALALQQALGQGAMKPGDHMPPSSFGTGLTWAAGLLDWE